MEKYGFSPHGNKEARYRHQRLMDMLQSLYGDFWSEKRDLIIRIPTMGLPSDIESLVGTPKDTLPALADDVANSICDDNTRDKFKKFANFLIEKLEKK